MGSLLIPGVGGMVVRSISKIGVGTMFKGGIAAGGAFATYKASGKIAHTAKNPLVIASRLGLSSLLINNKFKK